MSGPDDDEPGDPVCWLHRLCEECGAMPAEAPEGEPPGPCWRCGNAPERHAT